MEKIINYLIKSGYDQFIDPDDLYPIAFEEVHNKSSVELNEIGNFFLLIYGSADTFFPDKKGKNHLITRIYADDYQIFGIPKYFKKKYNSLDDYLISVNKNSVFYGIDQKKIEVLLKDVSFMEFIFEKYMHFASRTMQENYLRNVFSLEEYLAYILYNHARKGIYKVINYSLFSNLLKCDRTNLYRVISTLETQGVLEKDGKLLKIKSMEKLKFIFEEKF